MDGKCKYCGALLVNASNDCGKCCLSAHGYEVAEKDRRIAELEASLSELTGECERARASHADDRSRLLLAISEEARDEAEAERELESLRDWKRLLTDAPEAARDTIVERLRESNALEPIVSAWREKLATAERERDEARDKLADYDHAMLARFDPDAAEHTDLYTYIDCLLAQIKRMKGSA